MRPSSVGQAQQSPAADKRLCWPADRSLVVELGWWHKHYLMLEGLKAGAMPFLTAFQYASSVALVTRLGSSPCLLVICKDAHDCCVAGKRFSGYRLEPADIPGPG